jgi:diguanylate cyclase (GGDEF)-like protein
LAVVLIDIDTFQTINESYGHEAGDEAIKELSRLLTENINKDSIIARLGADQFCVLFKNRPYAEIHQTFQEIIKIVENNRFTIDNLTLDYTISVGANIDYSDSLEDMIELADEALANAKYKGSSEIVINS